MQVKIENLYKLLKNHIVLTSRQIIVVLSCLTIAGCAFKESTLIPPPAPTPVISAPTQKPVLVPAPEPVYETLQDEIERLEKVIVEKDKVIRNQHVRQKDQDQVLQEATDEVTRAQVKLHRLATKPSAASTIAEVEVAMESLRQQQISVPDQALQSQAQYILDAATIFYTNDEYAAAMNYATQAHDIINMIADQNRRSSNSDRATVKFYAPVIFRTKADVNLRKGPNKNTAILSTLNKGDILTAHAYQGEWLQVHTKNDAQGWVFSTLVEIQASDSH